MNCKCGNYLEIDLMDVTEVYCICGRKYVIVEVAQD
jgi:hypothetical protein